MYHTKTNWRQNHPPQQHSHLDERRSGPTTLTPTLAPRTVNMPNPFTDRPDPEEARRASMTAARGALIGGVKWGLIGLALAGVGQLYSPLYRGLTIQFKV